MPRVSKILARRNVVSPLNHEVPDARAFDLLYQHTHTNLQPLLSTNRVFSIITGCYVIFESITISCFSSRIFTSSLIKLLIKCSVQIKKSKIQFEFHLYIFLVDTIIRICLVIFLFYVQIRQQNVILFALNCFKWQL